MLKPGAYLPHIDGLRTFAVLSVFLFHLDMLPVAGGYLGVDVFFVISGFLITHILKQQAESQGIGIASFYARRVRRLFPALVTMMLFCLIIGLLRYSPDRLVELADSGLWAVLSVSNFFFYLNNDYFDAAAESQVFLHTWSLGVEEQFYLVWPLLLMFVIKYFSRAGQLTFIVLLCLFGSLLSYLGTLADASMAFYMMPFRVAEFSLGAILCWLPRLKLAAVVSELLVSVALVTMLAGFLLISEQYHFPGLWFLVPCIATSVLIHLGDESRLSLAILGNPVSTYIGRISYSLYLFHWPVIVFMSNERSGALAIEDQVTVLLIATLLAMATYHFVEQPFRRAGTIWPSNRQVALKLVVCVTVFTVLFWWVGEKQGFPDRVPAQIRSVMDGVGQGKDRRFDVYRQLCRQRGWEKCETLDPEAFNVLILGDSHGIDALNALHGVSPGAHLVPFWQNGCPPMTVSDFKLMVNSSVAYYDECDERTRSLARGDMTGQADMLVISSRYSWYTPLMLDNFLNSLNLPAGYPVVIFGQAPTYTKDLPDIIYQHGQLAGLNERAAGSIAAETWQFGDELRAVAMKHHAVFIPKAGYFCDADSNQCDLFHGDGGQLLTYDRHHLSYESAKDLGDWLSASSPGLIVDDAARAGRPR